MSRPYSAGQRWRGAIRTRRGRRRARWGRRDRAQALRSGRSCVVSGDAQAAAGWRVRCAAASAVTALGVIGFAGFERSYPDLLRVCSKCEADELFLVGIAVALGLGPGSAALRWLVVGGAASRRTCVYLGAEEATRQGAFACAIVATLALTPVVLAPTISLLLACRSASSPALLAGLASAESPSGCAPRDGHGDRCCSTLVSSGACRLLVVPLTSLRRIRSDEAVAWRRLA